MLNAKELYQLLLDAYGEPRWWSEDPFTVMYQAVLVQNTVWSSVEKVSVESGHRLSAESVQALPLEELEALIRPCGFCKSKARTIQALATWFLQTDIREISRMSIPELRKDLLSIRGVGPETADVILVYAFYRPSFVIDAYTRRLLSRIGYDFADDASIRQFFEGDLPQDARLYGWYHWLILDHCISWCKKNPKCGGCPLKSVCRQRV